MNLELHLVEQELSDKSKVYGLVLAEAVPVGTRGCKVMLDCISQSDALMLRQTIANAVQKHTTALVHLRP